MSNSRVFDYTEISNLYNKMNTITGDKSDSTSIAGILEKINLDYTDVVHGVVGEDEMAIFGELGQQMLLNWENTSANFPNFVENFSAWSTLVAQAAGDYSQFEQQVQGIRTASPLGWASGGIQDSFITTSVYANALSEQEIADLAAQSQFHQLTGATYIDTGMVSFLNKSDIWEGVELVLDVATIVTGGFSVAKYFRGVQTLTTTGAATQGIKNLGPLRGGMTQAGQRAATAIVGSGKNTLWTKFASSGFVQRVATGTGRTTYFLSHLNQYGGAGRAVLSNVRAGGSAALGWVGAGASAVNGIGGTINSFVNYDPNYYQTGNGFTTVMGDEVTIGGQTFNFLGQASNGTSIYADASGNVVTAAADGTTSPVVMTTSGGGTVYANMNNLDEDSELSVAGQQLGAFNSFALAIDATPTEDFDGYYDTLNTNMERLQS